MFANLKKLQKLGEKKMNPKIHELRLEIDRNERKLNESLSRLAASVELEKLHTLSLIKEAETKAPLPPTAPATATTKVEKLSEMSDRELINLMGNPKKTNELLSGW